MEHKKSKALGIAVAMAVTMLSLAVVVVTFAWLYDKTQTIKNTWTVGKVYITLAETTSPDLHLIPGETDAKDPTVTVQKNSEDCYVFVKILEDAGALTGQVNFEDIITYEVADGWTALDGQAGVYYRRHTAQSTDAAYHVLKDDRISYPKNVTGEQLQPAWAEDAAQPTLSFIAYAIQDAGFDNATAAWEQLMEIYPSAPATPTP